MKSVDLTGQTFGRLTVVCRGPNRGASKTAWECTCSCGNTVSVQTASLRYGSTRSCGCLRIESSAANALKLPKMDAETAAARRYLASYKWSAKRRGLIYSLADDAALFMALGHCFYCGALPARRVPSARKKNPKGKTLFNGIDRRDNSLGYVAGNCVSCCLICNRGKNSLPAGAWISYLDQLVAYRSKR